MWPEIAAAAGSRPFEPDCVELEIAAHGDGAFFRPHSDVPTGAERAPRTKGALPGDRVVSAVFYYRREPQRFSGGALGLYRFGARTGDGAREGEYVDLDPRSNSLVAFPSWRSTKCVPSPARAAASSTGASPSTSGSAAKSLWTGETFTLRQEAACITMHDLSNGPEVPHAMNPFHCTPMTPWGIHHSVRNDEACPRCGWTAPGPRSDARRVSEVLAAEHGWTLTEGGVAVPQIRKTRAA